MPQDNLDNPGADAPKYQPANWQGNEGGDHQAQQEFGGVFNNAARGASAPAGIGASADGSSTENKTGDLSGEFVSVTQANEINHKVIQNIFYLNSDATSPTSLAGALDSIGSMLGDAGDLDAETKAVLEKLKTKVKHPSLPGAGLVRPRESKARTGETSSPAADEEIARWTDEELSRWYADLQESERSFVQAVAVLHGAPRHEIIDASKEIFASIKQETSQRIATPAALYQRTHTEARTLNNVTRIFWEDADASGLSAFNLRILRFIGETEVVDWTHVSQKDQSSRGFFDLIKEWPMTLPGEGAWRAARALGVMWEEDTERLRREVDRWVNSKDAQDWTSAAALLDGAYELERFQASNKDSDPKQSRVLQWISDWVVAANRDDQIGPGCAAAYAYGLIGRQYPQIALEGLDRLLGFPRHRVNGEIRLSLSILSAGLEAYLTMAASGHLRAVLVYLATVAESLVHRPVMAQNVRQQQGDKMRRDIRLFGIFTTFFLLAAISNAGTGKKGSAGYGAQPLPNPLPFPDEEGRDVLLLALLTQGSSGFLWRKSLTFLLCAALLDGNPIAVTQVLRRWAHIVVRQKDLEQPDLLRAYTAFLVDLGKLIQVWCDDLQGLKLRPSAGIEAFCRQLRFWQYGKTKEEPPLADLSRKVLAQLGC